MDKLDDHQLIDLALNGSNDFDRSTAFSALCKRYYETTFRYAFRWLQCQSDAEDVTQEVFMKLARALPTYKKQAAFSTWLYRVTANCARDFIRKNASWNSRRLNLTETLQENADSAPPEDVEFSQKIIAAMNRLPYKLKETMLLVFAEGLTHKEAAQVLHCAETTISWRIFMAKKKLKKVLA